MLGALYKDFICSKKLLIGLTAGSVGIMALFNILIIANEGQYTDKEKPLWILCPPLILYIVWRTMTVSFLQADEKRKTAYFTISSPDGVRKAVGEKYIAAFIVTLIWYLICSVVTSLFVDIMGLEIPVSTVLMPFVFISFFQNAFDLPFYFAFTTKNGGIVKTVSLLGLIGIGLIYMLFGDLSILDRLKNSDFNIIEMLMSNKAILIMDIIFAVSLVLYYISYRISLAVFKKGVDRYVK